jgi:hypothetical protein
VNQPLLLLLLLPEEAMLLLLLLKSQTAKAPSSLFQTQAQQTYEETKRQPHY